MDGKAELSASELTRECQDAFEQCIAMTGFKAVEWAEIRLADLNLWAAGVGAFASKKSSLDARFENRPDDLILVKSNLSILHGFLQDCIHLAKHGKSTELAMREVDLSIEDLAMIAVAIRRTGLKSHLRHADKKFVEAEHKNLKKHLECIAVLRPSLEGREEWTRAPKLTALQKRLVEANLRRRNRFLRAQERAETLKGQPPPGTPPVNDSLPDLPAEPNPVIANPTVSTEETSEQPYGLHEPEPEHAAGLEPPPQSESTMLISVPEDELEWKAGKDTGSQAPKTLVTSVAVSSQYPRLALPKKDPDTLSTIEKINVMCPCCCKALPVGEMKYDKTWREENPLQSATSFSSRADDYHRNHLSEDIFPYTCIAKDCPTPYALYKTKKEWETHVNNDHPRQLRCPFCRREDLEFNDLDAIASHVKTTHADAISQEVLALFMSEDFLPTLLSWSTVQIIGIEQCPLCKSAAPRDSRELIDHVLDHVHEFSLRSLPWPRRHKPTPRSGTTRYNPQAGGPERADMILEWVDAQSFKDEVAIETIAHLEELLPDPVEEDDEEPTDDFFEKNDYFLDEEKEDSLEIQTSQSRSSRSTASVSSIPPRKRLYESIVKNTKGQQFLPENELNWLTKPEQIISAFEEHGLDYDDDLVFFASVAARRVFLTLVKIENLQALKSLRLEGFNDSHLPVGGREIDSGTEDYKRGLLYETVSLDAKALRLDSWKSFSSSDWTNHSHVNFISSQWTFLAPVFTMDQLHYNFHPEHPLPYVSNEGALRLVSITSSFSQIVQVRIHDAHQLVLALVRI